jgi:beta-glucosidase
MDPVLLGRYPEDGLRTFAPHLDREIRNADLSVACPPLDFLGVNIYSGIPVRAGSNGQPEEVPFPPGFPQSAIRWWVIPESLYWGPRFYAERYRLPVLITENGFSGTDWVAQDGNVHDPQRIDFTHRYLLQLHRAVTEGIDVRGYFHWSILDNFEWSRGYQERFGLVHVDFETQQRTPKDSAGWYAEVIRTNGESLFR